MKYYTYRQNNSGGYHTGPAKYVIVQADTSDEADSIAESLGLYFDGSGDCPCCGNRWSTAWDASDEPEVYRNPVTLIESLGDNLYTGDFDDDWAKTYDKEIPLCIVKLHD